MRIFTAIVLTLGLLLPAAQAENYSSSRYGFSADFPGSVTVVQPPYPGKGEAGNPITAMDVVMSIKPKAYLAFVVDVEMNVPLSESDLSPQDMDYLRDKLLEGMKSQAGNSSSGKFQGYPALTFSFTNADKGIFGRGRMVIVPGEKAKIYIVLAGVSDNSTADERAALDDFFESFRLQ